MKKIGLMFLGAGFAIFSFASPAFAWTLSSGSSTVTSTSAFQAITISGTVPNQSDSPIVVDLTRGLLVSNMTLGSCSRDMETSFFPQNLNQYRQGDGGCWNSGSTTDGHGNLDTIASFPTSTAGTLAVIEITYGSTCFSSPSYGSQCLTTDNAEEHTIVYDFTTPTSSPTSTPSTSTSPKAGLYDDGVFNNFVFDLVWGALAGLVIVVFLIIFR